MDITGLITGLITEIAEEFSFLGLIEKFIAFFETNSLLTFIIFAVSLFLLYRLVKLTFRIFLVVIAGVLFPFAMNLIFDWGIPINMGTLIFYATAAVVLFLLAVFLKSAGKFLGFLSFPIRKRTERKRIEKDIEEDLEKKKKH